jgi:hypothetical protein
MILRISESSVEYRCAEGDHEGVYRPEKIMEKEIQSVFNLKRLG